ncbi:hypothetical protein [Nocardia sp. NPDC056100]|uniref:hypothetical protein n=1 Tax=Nocardia sp. NPDC056100 TaxID=3345712 RepID=UPI0035E1209B
MNRRRTDSGRITRAALSAGALALIIVAKAGSMTFGYSFPNSLLILLVVAAIVGAYLLFQRRERPGSSGTSPTPPAAQRVTGPAATQQTADPAAAVATVSAQALISNHQEPPTMPVHYSVATPDDPPTVGIVGTHDDPPTVGLSESVPVR